MIGCLRDVYYTVTQKYLIEVAYEPPIEVSVTRCGPLSHIDGKVFTPKRIGYLAVGADGNTEIVDGFCKATFFDFFTMWPVMKRITRRFAGNGLQIYAVTVADAALIEHVTSGPKFAADK